MNPMVSNRLAKAAKAANAAKAAKAAKAAGPTKSARMLFVAVMAAAIACMLAACGSNAAQTGASSEASTAASSQAAASAQTGSMQTWDSTAAEAVALLENADAYMYGAPGTEQDVEKAQSLYEQAAGQGSPYATYMLGELLLWTFADDPENANIDDYETALNDVVDQQAAYVVKALDMAEAMPEDSAEANLVFGLYSTQTSNPSDAVPYLTAAASANVEPYSAFAMVALGDLYSGDKVSDLQQAAQWYGQAVDFGYARAILKLADLYQYDLSNPGKAIEWYTKAIDLGYSEWYELGTAYILAKDYDSALAAYKQGYENGSNACAYGMGNVYFVGSQPDKALDYYEIYLNNREAPTSDNYTDMNESHIKKYVKEMVDRGMVDIADVNARFGEGFIS